MSKAEPYYGDELLFLFCAPRVHETCLKMIALDGRCSNASRDARYGMVLSETLPFAAYILDVCSLTSYALWIRSQQRR